MAYRSVGILARMSSIHRTSASIAATAIAISSLLGGCAPLNPLVSEPSLVVSSAPPPPPGPEGLADAKAAVGRLQLRYGQAAHNMSVMRGLASLAVLGAGATALYLGLIGEGGQRIFSALGVGGATILGGANFYDDRATQQLYLDAKSVLSCVVAAYAPLDLSPAQYELLHADLARLHSAIGAAAPYVTNEVKDSANTAYQRVAEFAGLVDHAGESLRNQVIEIEAGVESALKNAQPDPSAIIPVIQQLASTAPLIAGVNLGPAAQAGQSRLDVSPEGMASPGTMAAAEAAANALAGAEAQVRLWFGRADAASRVMEAVVDCGTPTMGGRLSIEPSVNSVNATKPASLDFIVRTSDNTPPDVSLVGQIDGISHTVVVDGTSYRIQVAVGNEAKPSVVQLNIRDTATSLSRRVFIVVDGGGLRNQPENKTGRNRKKESSESGASTGLTEEEIKALQRLVNAPEDSDDPKIIDGNWGEASKAKSRDYQMELFGIFRDELNPTTFQNIFAKAKERAISEPPNAYETDVVNKDDIKTCQQKLNAIMKLEPQLDAGGVLDEKWRGVIWDYQVSRSSLPITGHLDEATTNAIDGEVKG